ncbi:16S rRNA (guanine966-N2)-methyltransferase [Rhodobium orientis]|uniref:16S rRNA (Guanine(966)-N(2))-methyltransferase RsmD n=1 Tax=Rhodobium orientis TaxID=34017 RepID=A0A327JRL5_9HYPH|nr:16S rRNA (guanine(966)-N(2))-methyltransferase RsmD [Rhodobium orientis]MBB4304207.1 16S rRNA (guanine966-N2)-methyltransferase [Rhodobium orientis]MBK5950676.1 16S rRNA (guanine(966)-N(2))-methyltransferase RsmD [Rhodobium orientis]RAI28053.1 16S rRNA (guanine(966)-N(2))-methyltransferase RsmD [Rhodobium orientis]
MRIVAGRFKGAAIAAPRGRTTRPTTDRLRESLFNVLAHGYDDPLDGARVLDLFAGSGALGLESLSRGARFVLFVEEGPDARAAIRTNMETLGATGLAKLYRRDATKLGKCSPMAPFDVVFLDPPYGKGLGEKALSSVSDGGWARPGAIVVLEEDRRSEIALPEGFSLLERRESGDTQLLFLQCGASE